MQEPRQDDNLNEPFDAVDEENGIGYRVNEADNSILAYSLEDPENEIGSIEVSDELLAHVNVDENYQRRGIGTRLIQLAIEHLGLDRIPCVMESAAYEFCLTAAGENLIASCIRHRIVTEDMCVFSGDGELLAEDASGDPQLDSLIVSQALKRNITRQTIGSDNEDGEKNDPGEFYSYDDDPEEERRLIAESEEWPSESESSEGSESDKEQAPAPDSGSSSPSL